MFVVGSGCRNWKVVPSRKLSASGAAGCKCSGHTCFKPVISSLKDEVRVWLVFNGVKHLRLNWFYTQESPFIRSKTCQYRFPLVKSFHGTKVHSSFSCTFLACRQSSCQIVRLTASYIFFLSLPDASWLLRSRDPLVGRASGPHHHAHL